MLRSRLPQIAILAAVILASAGIMQAVAVAPANEHFQRTWARTDKPVADGVVPRTWMWGPEAFTQEMSEPYAESPGGERAVQYFDKARMEINDPSADPASLFFVTNGLLVVELISGRMQTGHNSFIERHPAEVNVAGDADDPSGPTYASFGAVLDAAPLATGTTITQRIDRAGNVTSDPSLAGQGVTVAFLDDVTNHAIAAPFWNFMNATGTVYESGQFSEDELFENPYFATGRPVTEAYWADVLVGGTLRLVLMQCFERRCLTYTPGNPEGFVVEAGNVGQHYYAWRYATPDPTATPTATPSPSPTESPSPSPEPDDGAYDVPGPDSTDSTIYGQNGGFAQALVHFDVADSYPASVDLRTGVYFGIGEEVGAYVHLYNDLTATHSGLMRVTADIRWNGELWTFGLGDMNSSFYVDLSATNGETGEQDVAASDTFTISSPTATTSVVGSAELVAYIEVTEGDEIQIRMDAFCSSVGSVNIIASDTECDFAVGSRNIEWHSLTIEYLN